MANETACDQPDREDLTWFPELISLMDLNRAIHRGIAAKQLKLKLSEEEIIVMFAKAFRREFKADDMALMHAIAVLREAQMGMAGIGVAG